MALTESEKKELEQLKALREGISKRRNPGFTDPGGFLDKNVLSGQMQVLGGGLGGAIGAVSGAPTGGLASPALGILGAGGGAIAGQTAEDLIRSAIGLPVDQAATSIPGNLARQGQIGTNYMAGQALGYGVPKAIGMAANTGPGQFIGRALKSGGKKIQETVSPSLRYAYSRLGVGSMPEPIKQLSRKVSAGNTQSIQQALESGNLPIGQEAAMRQVYGTKQSVLSKAQDMMSSLGNQLDDVLAKASNNKIDPLLVVKELDGLSSSYSKRAGSERAISMINQARDNFLSKYTSPESSGALGTAARKLSSLEPLAANEVKRALQSQAKSAYSKVGYDMAGVEAEIAESLARGLRKEIENKVGGQTVKKLNQELGFYKQMSDIVAKEIAKDLNRIGFGMGQNLQVGSAGAAGFAVGGVPGALAGTTASIASKSFPVRTRLAAMLARASGDKIDTLARDFMADPVFRSAAEKAMKDSLKGVFITKGGIENNKNK